MRTECVVCWGAEFPLAGEAEIVGAVAGSVPFSQKFGPTLRFSSQQYRSSVQILLSEKLTPGKSRKCIGHCSCTIAYVNSNRVNYQYLLKGPFLHFM